MKRLKKGQGIAWLVVLLACIVGFGYLAFNIVTATVAKSDDYKIRLGLDLAGEYHLPGCWGQANRRRDE